MWTKGVRVLVLYLLFQTAVALKTEDWKKCADSGFCRRGRALAARAEADSKWQSPYYVDASSVSISPNEARATATVKSSIYPDVKFRLDLNVLKDGVVRVRMDEVDGLRQRYNEAASWALISQPEVSSDIKWSVGKREVRTTYGEHKDVTIVVNYEPLKVTLLRGGKEEVVLNGGGLLHMEHFRQKKQPEPEPAKVEGAQEDEQAQKPVEVNPAAWFEGEPDAWWEETWRSWTDSKPKGASLVRACASVSSPLFRPRVIVS
jgi:alpha 1,3-glucosidase